MSKGETESLAAVMSIIDEVCTPEMRKTLASWMDMKFDDDGKPYISK